MKKSGTLMHITSLPSKYGIGDLGHEAYSFIDFLAYSRQNLWQILPLNPPDFTYSPYQSCSAFACNPMLISPDLLIEDGLLDESVVHADLNKTGFERAWKFKERLLQEAFTRFEPQTESFVHYCAQEAYWLNDYALFMSLKEHFEDEPWTNWPRRLARREQAALDEYRSKLSARIVYHKFLQYLFNQQWLNLKAYAQRAHVELIGDLPIFIAHDSADAWANQHLFDLDEAGRPRSVAGVPPDYFSATGQLWGNPHYNWNEMAKDDYAWWRSRINAILKLVDWVRIDHFRGFEAYWAVPYGETTAVNGRWLPGPGRRFFEVLAGYFGRMPFIAEDLGVITDDVIRIKNDFRLPGMKILQFDININEQGVSFDAEANSVVYTGTHDNNTTIGWFYEELGERRTPLKKALGTDSAKKIVWRLIRMAYASAAEMVIIPMQDFLVLDSDARMNLPGTVGHNWQWQCSQGAIDKDLAIKIMKALERTGRV